MSLAAALKACVLKIISVLLKKLIRLMSARGWGVDIRRGKQRIAIIKGLREFLFSLPMT
jgi:hypothetical protein